MEARSKTKVKPVMDNNRIFRVDIKKSKVKEVVLNQNSPFTDNDDIFEKSNPT